MVLTTTGGGEHGPSGPLIAPVVNAFPDMPIIDRQDYLDAMADPRFSNTVRATRRKKLILSGVSTDFCFVYPTAFLIDEADHVLVPVDASGSWTSAIYDDALQRVIQMGGTPISVRFIA